MSATAGIAALQAAGQIGSSAMSSQPLPPDIVGFSPTQPINVQPVGLNLGAVLRPYNESSPETGGFGMGKFTRYRTAGSGASAQFVGAATQETNSTMLWILGALVVGAGAWLVMRR